MNLNMNLIIHIPLNLLKYLLIHYVEYSILGIGRRLYYI